jgi:hypothetical protein
MCTSQCVGTCSGKECGDDGCGESCGTCDGDLVCKANLCLGADEPIPDVIGGGDAGDGNGSCPKDYNYVDGNCIPKLTVGDDKGSGCNAGAGSTTAALLLMLALLTMVAIPRRTNS